MENIKIIFFDIDGTLVDMQRKEIYGFQSHLSICEINEVLEDWKSELNAPHP